MKDRIIEVIDLRNNNLYKDSNIICNVSMKCVPPDGSISSFGLTYGEVITMINELNKLIEKV